MTNCSLSMLLQHKAKTMDDACYALCLRYLMRCESASSFNRKLKKWTKDSQAFRMLLTQNAYYFLNLRYYAIHALATNRQSPELLKEVAISTRIYRRDYDTLMRLRANTALVRDARSVRKRDLNGVVPTPSALRNKCECVVSAVEQAIQRAVRSKLRFVSVFNGVDFNDLVGDVRSRLVQQFYWSYKERDDQWQIRMLLQTMHNHIRNMSQYYSTSKRKVSSERDANGISTRLIVHEQQLGDLTLGDLQEAAYDESAIVESRLTAHQILTTFGTTLRKRQLLLLLSGLELLPFTRYLQQEGVISADETCGDYLERATTQEFVSAAGAWLGFKQATKFLTRVRKAMGAQ